MEAGVSAAKTSPPQEAQDAAARAEEITKRIQRAGYDLKGWLGVSNLASSTDISAAFNQISSGLGGNNGTHAVLVSQLQQAKILLVSLGDRYPLYLAAFKEGRGDASEGCTNEQAISEVFIPEILQHYQTIADLETSFAFQPSKFPQELTQASEVLQTARTPVLRVLAKHALSTCLELDPSNFTQVHLQNLQLLFTRAELTPEDTPAEHIETLAKKFISIKDALINAPDSTACKKICSTLNNVLSVAKSLGVITQVKNKFNALSSEGGTNAEEHEDIFPQIISEKIRRCVYALQSANQISCDDLSCKLKTIEFLCGLKENTGEGYNYTLNKATKLPSILARLTAAYTAGGLEDTPTWEPAKKLARKLAAGLVCTPQDINQLNKDNPLSILSFAKRLYSQLLANLNRKAHISDTFTFPQSH